MTPAVDTVAALVERSACMSPEVVALVAPDGHSTTYAELVTASRRLGHWLLAQGLEPGDRVALWCGDDVEHVQAYLACALTGLVAVPVNARFTEHEARHLLSDSGASLLLHGTDQVDRAAAARDLVPGLRAVRLGGPQDLAALVVDQPDDPLPPPGPDDLLAIGYTSGTTGRPKGAVLTQGSIATLARMNALSYRLPLGSVAAMTGSLSFVAVMPAHVISHFYVRGTVRMLGRWTVPSLVDAIERDRATFTYVPSPMIEEFANAVDAAPERCASLVSVLHSASRASRAQLERLASSVGGALVEGWGMTEHSGGLMTATTPGDVDPERGRLGTVGRPVAEVEVAVLDDTGAALPHDGRALGELAFRSPALMKGYWERPEATAAAIVDGWFRTGDLGTIDADGYVTMSERRVDLIVSGGMNVYPFEVEQVLATHDSVAACCVVGVPHQRWGQSVAAAVVRRDGVEVTADELVAHCRTYLASYKKPTSVTFVEALPTTTSLKVSRARVREMLA